MASSSSSKRLCTFTDNLRSKYPFMKAGRNLNEAKCTVCDSFVSIKHKGASDIEKHIFSEKHKKNNLTVSSSQKLDTFFQAHSSSTMKKKTGGRSYFGFSYH